MTTPGFFEQYDDATLAKLRIFELYAQEWIPVFLARPQPDFLAVHIFDFFSGPGGDQKGVYGSPLRILDQLRLYHSKGLAGWGNVPIHVHLFDKDRKMISQLHSTINQPGWRIPGVQADCRQLAFQDALAEHNDLLSNGRVAKLLIIDQYGVDEVSDDIFKKLIEFPTTDFIFFLSSSTFHRFRSHPAIKQKIGPLEDSYDVHRVAVDYYRNLIPKEAGVFLAPFSIKKRSNVYGLVFCSHHPLGIHKFLKVAWDNDQIVGEANFDIDRENISHGELLLGFEEMRPTKVRVFEAQLEQALRRGEMRTEANVVRFCIEAGMTCQHSAPILKKLKAEGVIGISFRVPDVQRLSSPRPILMK
jgi:three-Cys-motif partner protein